MLTEKTRNKLMPADFGLPKSRGYPIENKAHAADAKGRATQEFNAGRINGTQTRWRKSAEGMLIKVREPKPEGPTQ